MAGRTEGYRRWIAAADFVLMVLCLVLAWNTYRSWVATQTNRTLMIAVYLVMAIFFGVRSWRRRVPPPSSK